MVASSVTGVGYGSADGPIRPLSEIKKILTDKRSVIFAEVDGKIVARGWAGKEYPANQSGVLANDGQGNLTWSNASGTGDMLRSVYDPDEDGVVTNADHADTADSATNADTATNWSGLPANSTGYLKNDGSGTLSWDTPVATIPDSITVQDFAFEEGYEKWDDLTVPGTNTRAGTSAPVFEAFRNGVYLLGFVYNQVDEVHFTIQMPHHWKEGSNIYPHVHWTHIAAAPSNNQGVVWVLEYTWANINDIFPATSTMTAALEWTTSPPPQYKHILTPFVDGSANAYINGTGKKLSSQLICRLYRNTVDSRDDFDQTAYLIEIDFHYMVDSLGSDEEYIK